jgi:hypothetical protein
VAGACFAAVCFAAAVFAVAFFVAAFFVGAFFVAAFFVGVVLTGDLGGWGSMAVSNSSSDSWSMSIMSHTSGTSSRQARNPKSSRPL